MFDKVLILSASVGAGHMRPADALDRAFVERRAAREVRHVDTPDYATSLLFFGEHQAPNGHEDALVDVVGQLRHQELLKRPGNVVLARDDQHGIQG